MSSKIVVWTPITIDGFAVSAMLNYVHGNILHFYTDPHKFYDTFIEWYDEKGSNYDKIYICGFDLDSKTLNIIDRSNIRVIISDTYEEKYLHEGRLYTYNTLSCATHMYNVFSTKLHKDFKPLSMLCTNIESGNIGVVEFKHLTIFHGTRDVLKTKIARSLYKNGLRDFSKDETATYERLKAEMKRETKHIDVYQGHYDGINIKAAIVDDLNIDIYNKIDQNNDYNMLVFVYPDQNKVILKKIDMISDQFNYIVDRFVRGNTLKTKGFGSITPELETLLNNLVQK